MIIDIADKVNVLNVNDVRKAISERENLLSCKRGTLIALKRDGYNPEIRNVKTQLMALQARLGRFEDSQSRVDQNIEGIREEINLLSAEIDALAHYLPDAAEQRLLRRFLAAGFTTEDMKSLMLQWESEANSNGETKTQTD